MTQSGHKTAWVHSHFFVQPERLNEKPAYATPRCCGLATG
jgi:hypothetical protein